MSSTTLGVDHDFDVSDSPELVDDSIVTSTHRIGRRIPDMVVGDLTERDILAMAPAMVCDRIHWSTAEPMSLVTLISELPFVAYTRAWSDGQSRVWVE